MSDEEKKCYQDKAAELKAEYQKALEADNAEDAEVNLSSFQIFEYLPGLLCSCCVIVVCIFVQTGRRSGF